MNKTSDELFQKGLVDLGLKVQNLETENQNLQQKIEDEGPVCPNCHEKMTPKTYKGYYDQFSYWDCNCSDLSHIENHQTEKGSYR